jgi:hypothetical protein
MWLRFSCFILQQCQCGHQFKFSTCKMSGGLVKHCPFPVHCGITCVKRCLCTPTVNGLLKGKSLLPQEASNYNRLSGILPLSANEVTGFLVLYSSDTLASCYCIGSDKGRDQGPGHVCFIFPEWQICAKNTVRIPQIWVNWNWIEPQSWRWQNLKKQTHSYLFWRCCSLDLECPSKAHVLNPWSYWKMVEPLRSGA